MQKQRQLEAKIKNEAALARAKKNESQRLVYRNHIQIKTEQKKFEKEIKQSEDREIMAQESMKAQITRQYHIQRTKEEAEKRSNEKILSAMSDIERKNIQINRMKVGQQFERQQQSMQNIFKEK